MKEVDKIKVEFTAIIGVVSSILGVLFVPVMLLVLCNIIDYITGLLATPGREEKIRSYKSIRGIIKKVAMWLLVIVGAVMDQLIKYSIETVGLSVPFTFLIACVVTIWLICNELISILENISDIGLTLPGFLQNIVYYIKDQSELKMDIENERDSGGV